MKRHEMAYFLLFSVLWFSIVSPFFLSSANAQLSASYVIPSTIDNEFEDNKLTLYTWNRKASLELGNYYIPSSVSQVNDVLTVKYAQYDMRYYATSDGGIEFDIILYYDARPNVVFSFPLTLNDFEAYYQPPLYQEINEKTWFVNETHAIDENGTLVHYRPENVVGSYAFYHKTLRNNEYTTGKAFHLYRPLVYDNGRNIEMFAEMYVTPSGVLQIYVPEAMFYLGDYPITIDPAFGKTDVGGTEYTIAADRSLTLRTANPEESTVDVTSITAYIKNAQSGTRQAKTALYDHDSGNDRAGDLLKGSDVENFIFGFDNWRVFDNTTYDDLSAGACWLAVLTDDALIVKYDSTPGFTNWRYKTMTYPTFLDPWGVPSWSTSRAFSIYANYTTLVYQLDVTYYFNVARSKLFVNLTSIANATTVIYENNTRLELIGIVFYNVTFYGFDVNGSDYTNNHLNYTVIREEGKNATYAITLNTSTCIGGIIEVEEMTTFVLDNAVLLIDVVVIALGLISMKYGVAGLAGLMLGLSPLLYVVTGGTLNTFTLQVTVITIAVSAILYMVGASRRVGKGKF